MIVYAEREQAADPRRELENNPDQIRFGQIEAGVADALCPVEDRLHPVLAQFRRVAVDFPRGLHELVDLPRVIRVRPPEGFAYYALYPEQYEQAACALRPEGSVVVCGIRSIGTTLSAIVARVLDAESITVRPRGHPFERHLRLAEDLRGWIRQRAGATWIVVDEGPGISGSSFAAVSRALRELGVRDERIVFFPGWDAPADVLRSESAQAEWRSHRRVVIPYLPHLMDEPLQDFSAGQWRDHLHAWPAVQPQHERRKFLSQSGRLFKFAGLGRFGDEKLARARRLREYTPQVEGLRDGFLITRFVEGRPLSTEDCSRELLQRMASYLGRLRSQFTTSRRSDLSALVNMMRHNAAIPDLPAFAPAATVAVDGRMLPHEWIRTREGFLKTDALDHYDDHFFPGCQDIAWDVAGAIVEFGMSHEQAAEFSELYLAKQQETNWAQRLRFHMLAYLAYRAGYARMAQESLGGSDDGRRFAELEFYYRERIACLTGALESSSAS